MGSAGCQASKFLILFVEVVFISKLESSMYDKLYTSYNIAANSGHFQTFALSQAYYILHLATNIFLLHTFLPSLGCDGVLRMISPHGIGKLFNTLP